jgi:hypothetical protein
MAVQDSAVPVVRSRQRREPVTILDRQAPAYPPLPPALESLFGLVAEPVLKLETAADGQRTVREIGILLGDVLDLLEEDQPITAAADRLYDSAFGLVDARAHQHTNTSITPLLLKSRTAALYRSLAFLRKRLCSAKPSAKARAHRIAW